jgi:glycosyltransferase involved in cell wall biosynthesis
MKTKVLHVTFDMTIGGAQQVIRQLVENMDKSEIQSEVVCIDNRLGELGEILQEQGIKVHLLNRQPGFDISLIKQLHQLIKTEHYDVIHCHQYSPYVYGLLASLLTSAKVIFTEHGRFYPDYGTMKRQLLNPIFSLFTYKITAISQATKDALVKFENFKASGISVIYNGIRDFSGVEVDKNTLKSHFSIPEGVFIFGTISRLQPIKNQAMMIRAFAVVHSEYGNTHLLIVGDGESRASLEQLGKELKLEHHITFTGFQKDPYQFHKVIDIFLLTSFSEGTSMTLLEAMSFSTPCIVTGVGGNPEIVINGKTGVVVPSNDVGRLSEAIKGLLTDEVIRNAFRKAGNDRFIEIFTADHMITRYQNIYIGKQ